MNLKQKKKKLRRDTLMLSHAASIEKRSGEGDGQFGERALDHVL